MWDEEGWVVIGRQCAGDFAMLQLAVAASGHPTSLEVGHKSPHCTSTILEQKNSVLGGKTFMPVFSI